MAVRRAEGVIKVQIYNSEVWTMAMEKKGTILDMLRRNS